MIDVGVLNTNVHRKITSASASSFLVYIVLTIRVSVMHRTTPHGNDGLYNGPYFRP